MAYAIGQVIDDPKREAWLKADSPDSFEDVEPEPEPDVVVKPDDADATKPSEAVVIKPINRGGRPPKTR